MENYNVIEQIGTGSYSTVYRAVDLLTNDIVAIKVMKFFYSKGKKLQDNELKTLKKFQGNPCIIGLRQFFIQNDVMVMVFELAGPNLLDYYKEFRETLKRTFNINEIKLITYQVAMALADMHHDQYMHRDLKPQNILLDKSTYAVKLVDFGLTKRWENNENTAYVATRWYRAPEVILGLHYDCEIDIFAFGSVMLEMFLGYEAFPGNDAIDQLNRIFSVSGTPTKQEWPQGISLIESKKIQFPQYPPTNLCQHIPGLTPEAVDLLTRMIKCNPRDRITAKQILTHPFYSNIKQLLPPSTWSYAQKLISRSNNIQNKSEQVKYKRSHLNEADILAQRHLGNSSDQRGTPKKQKIDIISKANITRKKQGHSDIVQSRRQTPLQELPQQRITRSKSHSKYM